MRELIRKKLHEHTVGIAGAGGLGSNCAIALARSGLGRLVIADFDVVSVPNLDRQQYFLDQVGMTKVAALRVNIERMDPGVTVEPHEVKLDPSSIVALFSDCDVIVEAFDSAEAKAMLIETVFKKFPLKWLVAASGIAGYGRCDAMVKRHSGKLVVIGDETSEVSESLPPLAPRVGVAANMQADAVLEILLGLPESASCSKGTIP